MRASTIIRSLYSAREVQIFCPLMRQPSGTRSERVRMRAVSEPATGSVTPNACSRRSPEAIAGRYLRFCSSVPCRSRVPMMYIWAWHADGLPPDAAISSSTTQAPRSGRPPPPYSSGMRAPSQPCRVSSSTNSAG